MKPIFFQTDPLFTQLIWHSYVALSYGKYIIRKVHKILDKWMFILLYTVNIYAGE